MMLVGSIAGHRHFLCRSPVLNPSFSSKNKSSSLQVKCLNTEAETARESPQKRVTIVKSGSDSLEICRVINGMWQTSGGWGRIDRDSAVDAMLGYADSGLSTFDMADHYGPAEDLYGIFINRVRRERPPEMLERVRGLTKWVPPPVKMTSSFVRENIDISRKRMDVTSLDMLQFHWWDYSNSGYLDALKHLTDLKEQGKIKTVALTNFDTERLQIILENGIPIVSNQVQHSIVDMRPQQRMAELCQLSEVKLITYGTVMGGLLSEKFLDTNLSIPFAGPPLNTPSLQKYKRMVDAWGGWSLFLLDLFSFWSVRTTEMLGAGEGVERWRCLTRRKQVDSHRARVDGQIRLPKALSVHQLIAIGVGSTIGAGVYVLVGTVAREHSGPALTISFFIAGIAAALSAFCYAELASRCPSAGSAYHYSYICVGEGVAWLIGWALILEYTIGGSAVARGISPNLAVFFGGEDGLPFPLGRVTIPELDIVVDPCAALLVSMVTAFLCMGIKESSFAQAVVTILNVCVMIFVIIAGGYLGFKSGWAGYSVSKGYFPFGVNGVLSGSATVFFAYIGFDSVASTAEEVRNPQRDLPWGIGLALSICCILYMLVSAVIVGLVPYYEMDPDTPISSAFATHGMEWAMYIITAGAALALCATLLGSILPQPRILMAMARDGLLPSFFSDVNSRTQVPVKGTIVTGICAAILSFFMDVSELAGMVSVGTLLAFTVVAISILILRYVPPNEVPLPSSFHESIHSVSSRYNFQEKPEEIPQDETYSVQDDGANISLLVNEDSYAILEDQNRRKMASLSILSICVGVLVLTSMASFALFPVIIRFTICGLGGVMFLCGMVALTWMKQDDGRHDFGHSGGFICPWVPFLPTSCILINTYLLLNLGSSTWFKVSIWLVIGVFVYIFYGRRNSSLNDAVYVPNAHVDEIYRESQILD